MLYSVAYDLGIHCLLRPACIGGLVVSALDLQVENGFEPNSGQENFQGPVVQNLTKLLTNVTLKFHF